MSSPVLACSALHGDAEPTATVALTDRPYQIAAIIAALMVLLTAITL